MDDRMALKRRIHALDFALWEWHLFLDTHPEDAEAMAKRQELKEVRKEAVAAYEEQYGPYNATAKRIMGNRWSWVDSPWPWEYGKEC